MIVLIDHEVARKPDFQVNYEHYKIMYSTIYFMNFTDFCLFIQELNQ